MMKTKTNIFGKKSGTEEKQEKLWKTKPLLKQEERNFRNGLYVVQDVGIYIYIYNIQSNAAHSCNSVYHGVFWSPTVQKIVFDDFVWAQ